MQVSGLFFLFTLPQRFFSYHLCFLQSSKASGVPAHTAHGKFSPKHSVYCISLYTPTYTVLNELQIQL